MKPLLLLRRIESRQHRQQLVPKELRLGFAVATRNVGVRYCTSLIPILIETLECLLQSLRLLIASLHGLNCLLPDRLRFQFLGLLGISVEMSHWRGWWLLRLTKHWGHRVGSMRLGSVLPMASLLRPELQNSRLLGLAM
jgi:hypothetical protein